MRVLFLMFVYPDMNKSFNMYTTLVEEFYKNGHDITVVAPGDKKTGVYKELEINILRVRTLPIKNVPNFVKGISNLLLPFQFGRALKKYYPTKKFDAIIIPTPPITLVDLAGSLKKQFNSKIYLILRDIFPQNAVDLGFMNKKSLLYKYFRKKEQKLYSIADFIGCMSPGNIEYVKKHNPDIAVKKLHELKNFQKLYKGFGHNNLEIKKKFGLENKFVVVFGGNMGKAQQLEYVVKLSEDCQKYEDVMFLLLGEGLYMNKLAKLVSEKRLNNIQIQKTIPKQEYQDLLNVCDLGLISLNENFTIPNIPSKTLDYFNVGLPVLASIDKATDYYKVLEEAQAGLWSYAGEHEKLKNNFNTIYHNPELRKQMGLNGRKYFEKYLTPDIAYKTIIQKLISNK